MIIDHNNNTSFSHNVDYSPKGIKRLVSHGCLFFQPLTRKALRLHRLCFLRGGAQISNKIKSPTFSGRVASSRQFLPRFAYSLRTNSQRITQTPTTERYNDTLDFQPRRNFTKNRERSLVKFERYQ